MRLIRALVVCLCVALAIGQRQMARAEVAELRVSKGYGIHYLPLYVMERQKLFEKHAAASGLGEIKVSYPVIDGGNNINEAMLSGALDIASIGVPGFLTLWAKAAGNPRLEVVGLAAVGTGSMYLNTRNPAIRTLEDFTPADKIALPGIKTSFAAVILQMAAARAFGDANYAKLDPLTVGMPYPEATAALLSGKTEIDSHVASPPFSYIELDHPGIHRVFNSVELLGSMTVIMAYTTRAFHERNPKLCAALIAAVDEAGRLIARDKRAAARIYNEVAAVKTSEDQILRILNDPDTHYTVTPEGVMQYATFMQRVGTIRAKPETWKDVFVPELGDRPGS